MPKTILPSFAELRRMRSGNKLSRFFRHFFEHKKAKRIVVSQLPIIILVSGLIQNPNSAISKEIEINVTLEINNLQISTQKGIQYPVKNVKISQGYHFFHPGIDLDGVTGDEIRPIMDGVVEEIQYSKFAYGNSVLVNHGNKIVSLYAHLSKIDVQKGQEITMNTKIGEMGKSGRASGDHLHLEIRKEGRPINPLTVLP